MNPADYLINLKGKPYLPVAGRIAIIRSENKPYSIKTTPLQIDMEQGFAVFQAEVWLDGILLGMGTKQESKRDFPDFVEKAETGAIGRALAISGFGTMYALQDFDEGERLADAPVTVKPKQVEVKQVAKQEQPPKANELTLLGHEFKQAVEYFEPGASVDRIKQVFRILTGGKERSAETLRLATDMINAVELPEEFQAMLSRLGTGPDAQF
jgi:hypothetical protein